MNIPRTSRSWESPRRKWWLWYVRDRRIVAAVLTAFAAGLGVVRSLIDLFNRRC